MIESTPTSFVFSPGSSTVTTASFTPSGSTLLIALGMIGNGNNVTASAITITDSLSATWKVLASKVNTNGAMSVIACKDAGFSPSSQTVTLTGTGSTLSGTLLTMRQFAGAVQSAGQPGAFVATGAVSTEPYTQAITPTVLGSQVVGVYSQSTGNAALVANGSTTLYQYDNGTAGDTEGAFEASVLTAALTALTLGFTNSGTTSACFSLAEILPATTASSVVQAYHLISPAAAPVLSQIVGVSIGSFSNALADTGALTDALTVPTMAITLADAGTMTDTPLGIAGTLNISLADSGALTDALTITQPTPLGDGGTTTDALMAVTVILLADGGALADATSSIATVTLADSGTLTDPTVFGGTFSKFVTDGGAATDLLSGFPIQLFDGGTGIDTVVFLPPPIFLNGEGVLSLVQEELAHPSARWFIPGSPRNKLKLPRPSTTPASPFVTAYIGIGSDPAGDSAILDTYTPKKTTVNYTVLTWASGAPQEGANEIRRE